MSCRFSAATSSATPLRILIAEPNTDMRMLYRRYLDSLGLQVVIAERRRVPGIRL